MALQACKVFLLVGLAWNVIGLRQYFVGNNLTAEVRPVLRQSISAALMTHDSPTDLHDNNNNTCTVSVYACLERTRDYEREYLQVSTKCTAGSAPRQLRISRHEL